MTPAQTLFVILLTFWVGASVEAASLKGSKVALFISGFFVLVSIAFVVVTYLQGLWTLLR